MRGRRDVANVAGDKDFVFEASSSQEVVYNLWE